MRPSLRPASATTALLLRPSCRWAVHPPLATTSRLSSSPSPPPPPPPYPSPRYYSSTTSSVNPTEISHFSALASSWWDPRGPSRPLHLMNPLRHDFIRSCLSSSLTSPPYQNLNYLDVGCGGGIFAESAARLPTTASVTAIDPSSQILTIARAHAKRDPSLSQKLTYVNASIETLPPRQVDVVSCFEVVEHVDYPSEFLDKLGGFVRPGGWLVMSTIARTWMSWLTTNLVAEDILGMVPKGTHDWNKYIHARELAEYFRKDGKWGAPQVMGVVFVPGCGWKEVKGSEKIGNYFLGVQRVV